MQCGFKLQGWSNPRWIDLQYKTTENLFGIIFFLIGVAEGGLFWFWVGFFLKVCSLTLIYSMV